MARRTTTSRVFTIIVTLVIAAGCKSVVTRQDVRPRVLRDVPSEVVAEGAHKWFKVGLAVILASGVFMVAGVAQKAYYNDFYWAKMVALVIGIVFVFAIKRPLLRKAHSQINPLTLKLVALASMTVWFTVAACGRWIGFS